jgi:hypothetical protein
MEEPGFMELVHRHLSQPEYLHVLLNPLPVYGVALGTVALLLAMWLRSRQAQVTALCLLCLSAFSAWPAKELGEKAYDHIEPMSDHNGYAWLEAHAQRAARVIPVFYALAAATLAGLAVPWKFPRSAGPLNTVILILALAALCAGGWIALAGGQIRHPEFRYGKPPETPGDYEKMRD